MIMPYGFQYELGSATFKILQYGNHISGCIEPVSFGCCLFSARSFATTSVIVFFIIHNFTIFAEHPNEEGSRNSLLSD